MAESAQGTVFEAVIVPHRSLTARGLRRLLAAIFGASLTVTAVFWYLGAWPVMGFCGGEVLLAVVLLHAHARGARAREVLLLSADGLHVTRTDARGRSSDALLPAYWLNVVLQEEPGRVPRLFLAARGVREEVATSLNEAEKRDLAKALTAALYRWRNPRFDNPQLR